MIIEIVTFETAGDISTETVIACAEESLVFLNTCPGYLGRKLLKGEGAHWIDYVQWATLGKALAAAKEFNFSPHTEKFNQCIKPGTVTMKHLEVALSD
ncbi:hypothetical protein [Edaphovirga cremea]|jgi:hypothetical protein|uniref:hypothetical protein n=1 Tax=Edaphovirga cremea TaxID=2267246 RepID=UPI000DEF5B39|nr:hypothetical protein [Edaphovirga cremea]